MHAQLVVCAVYGSASILASLVAAELINADSGPLGSERSIHFDALAKNQ